jgi:hypothetical protein
VAALDAQRAASLAAIPDGAAETNGVIVGEAAAAAMIALRAADGVLPDTFSPSGSTLAGVWQPTGGACTAGVLYHWQDLVPFAIQRPSDFLLEPPPSLTSNRYAMDYLEVNTMGNATSVERPADRAEIARFYAALSPPFMISMAARQIAARKGSSLSENARSFALLMVAINDSLIASFYNKYQYSFWRPVTAIHAGAADGNRKTEGDTTFAPLISTPCFPGYPSNHASGTNGGLEMLRRLFGAAGHEITITATVPPLTTVTPALPGIILTRHYTQLKGIADDVDDARVYGGIHFRFDQQGGNTLGRAVATYVFKNTLRPVNGQE